MTGTSVENQSQIGTVKTTTDKTKARASSQQLRQLWIVTHRWLGLILFIPLILLGLTGSALVWPEATEKFFHPNRYKVAREYQERSVADYLAAAEAALPDGDQVSALRMPEYAGQGILAGGKPYPVKRVGPPARYRVWLDPASAEVVADWSLAPDGMWYMHALHGHLATPKIGRPIVGLLGFILTFSALTGIWIWWPRNASFMKGMRWRRGPGVNTNLHYFAGIWSAIPLAIVAFTGAWIVFPNSLGAPVSFLAGEKAPSHAGRSHEAGPPPSPPMASPAISADEAVAIARSAGEGGRLVFIAMPTESRKVWSVHLACSAAPGCVERFAVNDETGAAQQLHEEEPSAADIAAEEMEQIHLGGSWGFIWKLFVFVSGFLPALFGVTGIVMWVTRSARKRKLKAPVAAPTA